MNKIVLSVLFIANFFTARAQYAPQVGMVGTTAIPASSSLFVGWGNACTVIYGPMDIHRPSLGLVNNGMEADGAGAADRSVVSLGDSGIATITFAHPIFDGPGADFAVFENGFIDPTNGAMAFLELAFVEVSSDGALFYRFPAASNTQTNVQIPGSGVYADAALINNLAGKYSSMYGTPFNLSELAGKPGLDIMRITHVRIVDVIGDIANHISRDNTGNPINDPYPTDFPTGGFDLDAVGVIHQTGLAAITGVESGRAVSVYPNPFTDELHIGNPAVQAGSAKYHATLQAVSGAVVCAEIIDETHRQLAVSQLPAGCYFLTLQDENGNRWVEKLLKQ